MRIASVSPPPPAVVPAPTPAAVAPISTSKRTTSEDPQPAKRTDATGTQIKLGNASQKTSLSRSPLQNLPVEILMEIAGHSSASSLRALRGVSQNLKAIAQEKMSAPQKFIFANGAALQARGYDAFGMCQLARRPVAEQDLVLGGHPNRLNRLSGLFSGLLRK